MPMRIFIYSLAMSIPMAMTLRLLLAPHPRPRQSPAPGWPASPRSLILAINLIRGGRRAAAYRRRSLFCELQRIPAALILLLVFLSMAWNFGFVLDGDRPAARSRDLAHSYDLTGVSSWPPAATPAG